MSDTVIRAEDIGKSYLIGHKPNERYVALRDVIANKAKGLWSKVRSPRLHAHKEIEEFWALKDVSFEVKRGERIGIIGRNGAGKSTLLKILSRITEPTRGRVSIKGRVASLLEVGTGFHPELTGKENIFMNGAILGMMRAEIKKKFDEIVNFAEIERFLDTPVKRYSSGMYVRLAFAVAAYLEPEILIVDEVLAVGDMGFQKKCLGKMNEVAKGGRTVLFVSHNMGAIRSLCESAIWLDGGQIVKKGPVDEVVNNYVKNQSDLLEESSYIRERDPEEVKGKGFYLKHVEMLNIDGEYSTAFRYNEKMILIVDFAGEPLREKYEVEFYIYNQLGQLVSLGVSEEYHGKHFNKRIKKIKIEIGPFIFTSGKYTITLSVGSSGRCDTWENAAGFTIIECQPFTRRFEMQTQRDGVCVLQHSFSELE